MSKSNASVLVTSANDSCGDNHGLLRIGTIWRRELVNVNKTRDNHLARLGEHFTHDLLVRDEAEIGSHIEEFGTVVHRLKAGKLGFVGFWLKAIIRLRKMHRVKPFDALLLPIGEEPLGLLICQCVKDKKSTPKLVLDLWDVPGLVVEGGDSGLIKQTARKAYLWLLPKILIKADVIVAGVVSTVFLNKGIPEEKIVTSENGIASKYFNPMVAPSNVWNGLPLDDRAIRLLYQGYLHESRGIEAMLSCVVELRKSGRAVQLLIVGPSSAGVEQNILKLAESSGIEKHVLILGEVPSEEIPGIVSGADICLCPLSDIEKYRWSYPVKVYEYMAMEKPIVASDLPGTSALIQHRKIGGCLYEPENTSDMIEQLMFLIDNPVLRKKMAAAGREFITGKDWGVQISSLATRLIPKVREN